MLDVNVLLPSKPRIVSEEGFKGIYEIDGLYAGYGHTLGNSLRRIILSSLPGFAITSVKIGGVPHEFSTIEGVKEDVITILLNLKRVRFNLTSNEPQTVSCSIKGPQVVTAGDLITQGQVEILNKDQHIAEITKKGVTLDIEMIVEKGLGYVAKEVLQKGKKVDIGTIALDAIFTPIRRVNYEVENMRVGERTDYNRLRITVETDGSLTPREALENSIDIMIKQLKAIVGFKEEEVKEEKKEISSEEGGEKEEKKLDADVLKTRIETIGFSPRILNALTSANIRTVGGLARKKEEDLLDIEGLGNKGIQEIKRALGNLGVNLK
ncbi:MAG: DNA-directed RNA polymerase subunit alpha [Patescibacteria group bacterium]|nr:DNA-directed RNA polymerase subunit alpha [Patescibacteria group bacterium]